MYAFSFLLCLRKSVGYLPRRVVRSCAWKVAKEASPWFAPNKKTVGNRGFALLSPVYHEKLNLWDYSKVRKTTRRNSSIKTALKIHTQRRAYFSRQVFGRVLKSFKPLGKL